MKYINEHPAHNTALLLLPYFIITTYYLSLPERTKQINFLSLISCSTPELSLALAASDTAGY